MTKSARRIIHTPAEMRAAADEVRRAGGTVGFVGTSGNLHAGHLSIVQKMRQECDLTVMPLFLAPVPGLLEFEPGGAYARNFDDDRKLAFDAGIDISFEPTREAMYPDVPLRVRVAPDDDLSFPWEGAENPAFMTMAATAQLKYWNVIGPCRAYVGEKDWIPLTVLRKMITDLSVNVDLIACPIMREADGVCYSSRNARLSAADRAAAPIIYQALCRAASAIENGLRDAAVIEAMIVEEIQSVAPIDYVKVVDAITLEVAGPDTQEIRIIVSAEFGGVHMFDNIGVRC